MPDSLHRIACPLVWGASLLIIAASGTGCAAGLAVDGYDAEYVEPPADIEVYPRYEIRDGYAYYVNGRWYHRHEGRWVRYRRSPDELERRRVREHEEYRE